MIVLIVFDLGIKSSVTNADKSIYCMRTSEPVLLVASTIGSSISNRSFLDLGYGSDSGQLQGLNSVPDHQSNIGSVSGYISRTKNIYRFQVSGYGFDSFLELELDSRHEFGISF